MILSVEHVTIYRYDLPVRGVVQSHRLQPSSFDGQKVLGWEVTVSDGQRGGGFRDGAGDLLHGRSAIADGWRRSGIGNHRTETRRCVRIAPGTAEHDDAVAVAPLIGAAGARSRRPRRTPCHLARGLPPVSDRSRQTRRRHRRGKLGP